MTDTVRPPPGTPGRLSVIYAVWIPLLVPLFAVPAARRGAEHLPPRTAAWTLTVLALILALSSTAALSLLVLAGALRLPLVADLGHLSRSLLGGNSPATVPAAVLSAVALTALGGVTAHRIRHHVRELRAAQRQFGSGAGAGDLSVRQDDPRANRVRNTGRNPLIRTTRHFC